jgi:hypothetical protein
MHEVFTGEPTGPMQNNDTKESPTCTHVISEIFSSFLEVYFGRQCLPDCNEETADEKWDDDPMLTIPRRSA